MDGGDKVVVRGTLKKWLLLRQKMAVADLRKLRSCDRIRKLMPFQVFNKLSSQTWPRANGLKHQRMKF